MWELIINIFTKRHYPGWLAAFARPTIHRNVKPQTMTLADHMLCTTFMVQPWHPTVPGLTVLEKNK
jgi:hypothetical protein